MPRTRRTPLKEEEAQSRRQKWNVPNWRNKEEYIKYRSLKGDALRWEFVRRNENYRNDWEKNMRYEYSNYDLNKWHDPKILKPPKFDTPCRLVEFSAHEPLEQQFHYMALAGTSRAAGLIFHVDLYHPITAQLDFIKEIHEKRARLMIPPEERNKRPNKRNNKDGRTPDFLLRVLDAYNEGTRPETMAEVFGGKDGISKSAMERTISFAKDFWLRLKNTHL